jgi:hypothetical protein
LWHGGSRGHPARPQHLAADSEYSDQHTSQSGREHLALAFLLAVFSGLFFGLVPVRQILRSDPWQIIRSGSTSVGGTRRFTLRDVLLGLQIAICAVLVTASLVAVRGLARSLQSNYGIQPNNEMLVKTDLNMAGYEADKRVEMEKRMLDAAAAIPGIDAVGYADRLPLSIGGGDSDAYTDATTDFRPTNAAVDAQNFSVSPDYFRAAGTALLVGRTFQHARRRQGFHRGRRESRICAQGLRIR